MTHLPVIMRILQKRQIYRLALIRPAMQQFLDSRVAMQGIFPAELVLQAVLAVCD